MMIRRLSLITMIAFLASTSPSTSVAAQQPTAKAFVTAAVRGDVARLEALLAAGADVNAANAAGVTALHAAKIRGYEKAAAFLVSKGADANAPLPALETVVDHLVTSRLAKVSPGVGVLVSRGGKVVLAKGYGTASHAHDAPFTADTKFRIGSVSKQFVACAILKLAAAGKLRVTDTLSTFVPGFPRGDEVTIEHLLHHTSGIHSYTSKPTFMKTVTSAVEPEELIESFKDDPYDFDPGKGWRYNNSGYFLLGHIVAKVSGKSLDRYLRDTFFKPLGMNHTGIYDHRAILKHEATGYSWKNGTLTKAVNWHMSRAGGAGALYSTVGDLQRWNEAVFGGKVLDAKTLARAHTPVVVPDAKNALPYGYGWIISDQRGVKMVSHGGGLHGFLTSLARYPEHDMTIAVFVNCSPPAPGLAPAALGAQIAEFCLWEHMKPRAERKAAANVDAAVFADYVGRYALGRAILTVTTKNDKLYARLTGQAAYQIHPASESEFFWRVVDAKITFKRNEGGEVTHAVHEQGGRKNHAKKLAEQVIAKVDESTLQRYVGKYDYGRGGTLAITVRKGRIFGQLTGQPKLELLPKSATAFFWKDVDAEIAFTVDDDGAVVKARHTQGGRSFDVSPLKE